MGAFKHGPGCDCCGSNPCNACGNCPDEIATAIYGYDPLGVYLEGWPEEERPRYLYLQEVAPFCFNYFDDVVVDVSGETWQGLYTLDCEGSVIHLRKAIFWFGVEIYNHRVAADSFSCDPFSAVFTFPAQAAIDPGTLAWPAHVVSLADTPFP